MSRFAKRPPKGPSVAGVGDTPNDPIFRSRFPTIWEYMTTARYDSGESRELSTLMVLFEHGQAKCCLNDRAEHRSMWVSAESFEGALKALEASLEAETGTWKQYQPYKKKR